MLSREELDEIALKVAEYNYNAPCITGEAHLSEMKHFAHALLCEVQKRLEVPMYWNGKLNFATPWELTDKERTSYTKDCTIKLTTLPLIEE